MTFVKICGIQEEAAALAAAEAGAEALGFVFAPSRRRVEPARAAAVARILPREIRRVGVFVDAARDEILEIAERVGLDWIQLHGREPASLAAGLGLPVLRAVRVGQADDIEGALGAPGDYLLLDSYDPNQAGGTGRAFPWRWARQAAARRRVILAGGLTPENVALALDEVRPFGVDVSSGVETDGHKDPEKIRRFIAEVRRWDGEQNRSTR